MAEGNDKLGNGLDGEGIAASAGFLAEENGFDRHMLWRIGSWGVAAVGAVALAVFANQWSMGIRRDALASADLTRQSQQMKSVIIDSQIENRRLSSAVETLNADRDRLYSRVTVLEQGLDTVTGSIGRQARASELAKPATKPSDAAELPSTQPIIAQKPADKPAALPSPEISPQAPAPVQTTVAAVAPEITKPEPVMPKKPEPASPGEPAAPEVIALAAPPKAEINAPPRESNIAVQRTDFGIDLGSAGSLDGLRVLWRSLVKTNKVALTPLRPIVVVKENNTGLGMQLRLIAGPLSDAAAAAKICASLSENDRACETTVFDGQRLAMRDEPAVAARPARKRITRKPQPAAPLSFLGR